MSSLRKRFVLENVEPAVLAHRIVNIERYPDSRNTARERLSHYLDPSQLHGNVALSAFDVADAAIVASIRGSEVWSHSTHTVPLPDSGTASISDDVLRFVLKEHAPLAMTDGACLHAVSHAATCHQAVAAYLHRIHARTVGEGRAEHNRANCFVALAKGVGLHFPDVASPRFFSDTDRLPSSLELPLFQLCLSLFPRSFLPEILGLALYSSLAPAPSAFVAWHSELRKRNADVRYLARSHGELDPPDDVDVDTVDALRAIRSHLGDTDARERGQVEARIWNGFHATRHLASTWLVAVDAVVNGRRFDPQEQMAALIARKAPHAAGYHPRLSLGKCPFDEMLAGDPDTFLERFAKTPYVRPGDAKNSRLLTKAIAFGGPMFRVFDREEIRIISRWIDSLKAPHASREKAEASPSSSPPSPPPPRPTGHRWPDAELDFARMSPRARYHYLLHADTYPSILHDARRFVRDWLDRAAVGMHKGDRAIPFVAYDPDALEQWLHEQHRRQVAEYHAPAGPSAQQETQTREEVIHDAVQLCPMILVDGSWLQKWGSPGLAQTEIGALLFKIHSDEIGNGEIEQNHPNIYRDLMTEMGMDIPHFDTMAFTRWHGFEDSAFQVPVFWLSISQFPRTFLPETLGLNLAMELSGVGGSYRAAKDMLKAHGFSTLFVELHNTIDNVTTGHTGMALEAIKLYMDPFLASGDSMETRRQWERIWIGYRALVPPTGWMNRLAAKTKRLIRRSA